MRRLVPRDIQWPETPRLPANRDHARDHVPRPVGTMADTGPMRRRPVQAENLGEGDGSPNNFGLKWTANTSYIAPWKDKCAI